MAKKAATAPAEPEVKKQPPVAEVKENQQVEEAPESSELLEDEVAERRNQRRSEWGTQCDRWLIRCQQKGNTVLLHIGEFDPTNKEAGIKAIPKRIDQHFVQFDFGDGREVWVGKAFLAGIEPHRGE